MKQSGCQDDNDWCNISRQTGLRLLIQSFNQIKFIFDKKEHNATQKNKANMSTGHKGSMKLH